MSLYREAGGRRSGTLVAVAAVAALLGGLVGLLIGSSGDEDASLEESVSAVREDVQPALSALELVQIEYTEAVSQGKVVAETEYQAAQDQVEAAQRTLDEAGEDLELLAPDDLDQAQQALSRLESAVQELAPAEQVAMFADEAAAAIRAATGESQPPT